MSTNLIWQALAIREVQEAYDNCEAGTPGAGERLLDELDEFIDFIQQHPKTFSKWRGPFQKVTLPHFPYMIVYHYQEGTVIILSFFHGKRDPEVWGPLK